MIQNNPPQLSNTQGVQLWFPRATGNQILDEILKQILTILYSLFQQDQKAIAALAAKIKPSTGATSVTTNITTISGGGGGTGNIVYIEMNITMASTIIPPIPTSSGTLLIYRIKQGGTAFTVTWGTNGATSFFGPPPIPLFSNTFNVVSFVAGSDNNWYVKSAILGASK